MFIPEYTKMALDLLTTEELQRGMQAFEWEPSCNPNKCFCGMALGWSQFETTMQARSGRDKKWYQLTPAGYILRSACSVNYEQKRPDFRQLVIDTINARTKEATTIQDAVPVVSVG